MNNDREYLRLLSNFHLVAAGLTVLLAMLPLFEVTLGVTLIATPFHNGQPLSPDMGLMSVLVRVSLLLGGWALAAFMYAAAGRLRRQAAWTFCFAVAVLECLAIPHGTLLGVFTIGMLIRPQVRALFVPAQPLT